MSHPLGKRAGGSQRVPTPGSSRLAEAPLWHGRKADFSLEAVAHRIAGSRSSVYEQRPSTRASAVLALLADGPQGAEVLLTRRSSRLSNHSGEVSFPGGRLDDGESVTEAAMREAYEEVGIESRDITIVGELSPIHTYVSKSFIQPLVGVIDHRPTLTLNPHEVERALWVPLIDLVRPDTFHWEWWQFDHEELRGERPMFFFHLDDETVWGATARLLHEMLCRVHGIDHVDIDEW